MVPLATGIVFGMTLGANHYNADVINNPTVNIEFSQGNPLQHNIIHKKAS